MLKKIEGIVLKSRDYSETHKIITIFTKQLGIITALSRGANKPKSRLSSVSQVFIQGDFLIYVSKGLSTVQQGEIIQSFRHIREDIIKTAYAAYIVELTDKLLEVKQPDPFLYDQLYRTLTWINENDEYTIPMVMYELKMYKKGGFAPIIDQCVNCNRVEFPFAFSIQEGGLICHQCLSIDPYAIRLTNSIAKLLPILENVGLERIGTISVKEKNQQTLQKILHHYYDQYGGYALKSKKFLTQLDLLKD